MTKLSNFRVPGVRRRVAALLVGAVGLFHGLPAQAEDIPTVKLTEAGPNRDLPLGPFYLSGTASKGTQKVQAFVVRTSSPWLFGGEAPSCSVVYGDQGEFVGKKADELPAFLPGKRSADEIWAKGKAWPTIVTAAWTPKDDTKDEDFSLFVNAQDFFEVGASYCVFAYAEKKKDQQDKASVARAVGALRSELKSCPEKSRTLIVDGPDKGTSEQDKCEAKALTDFENAFKALPITDKERERVAAEARVAWSKLTASQRAAAKAKKLLEIWGSTESAPKLQILRPQELPERLYTEPGAATSLEHVAGQAIARLLVHHGALQRDPNHFYDGKLPVFHVRVLADGQDFEVSDKADKPGQRKRLLVKADSLTFPATDITLQELLELLRNRVRVDAKYVSITSLQRQLRPILEKSEPTADDNAFIDEVTARISALGTFVGEVLVAHKKWRDSIRPDQPIPTPSMSALFGAWLNYYTAPCSELKPEEWPADISFDCSPDPPEKEKAQNVSAWRGYSAPDGPLGLLAQSLGDFTRNQRGWVAAGSALATHNVVIATSLATEPFGKKVEFTQSTWLFTYVTPVVGYGVVTGAAEKFNIGYYGAQIHFVPNSVNDPLWSHGLRDFARFAAVEIGAALPATQYGPGNRFRGWKGLPPLFLGATLHILPYTGLSGGMVLLERRSSLLTEERATAFTSFYVGLNVQVNVPDLIRSSTTSPTTKSQ